MYSYFISCTDSAELIKYNQIMHKCLAKMILGNVQFLYFDCITFTGDVLQWEEQVRFRHGTTLMYLCIEEDGSVHLVPDRKDPRTVFRLHAVMEVS